MSTINKEIREIIVESGAVDVFKCYQCGKCTAVCPWFTVFDFPIYRIPQEVRLGLLLTSEEKEEIEKEVDKVYRCMGCEICVKECPHGVNLPEVFRAIRKILVDYGSYPSEIKSIVSKLSSYGNPIGKPQHERIKWAEEFGINKFTLDKEYLYFSCCIHSYDTRGIEVSRGISKILTCANISFGVSEEIVCCGESISRTGNEKVFNSLSKQNIENMKKIGVKNIIVGSPHCYTILKENFNVLHSSQIFSYLIKEEKIKPKKEINKKVVYHDPCVLGRQNGIYDEPRFVLKSIPGLELLDVENFSREYSICCGGGSCGVWRDFPINERVTYYRLEQLVNTGADIIAVACPYCLSMFEDAVKTKNLSIEVKDIAEILAESL